MGGSAQLPQVPRAAPPGALASRLALHALVFGNARAVATLWLRFVRELRFSHWEPLVRLPRMPAVPDPSPAIDPTMNPSHRPRLSGAAPLPDLAAGLLHQKLQLLDHCVAVLRQPGTAFEPPLPSAGPRAGSSAPHGFNMGAGGGAPAASAWDNGAHVEDDASASDYGTCSEGESEELPPAGRPTRQPGGPQVGSRAPTDAGPGDGGCSAAPRPLAHEAGSSGLAHAAGAGGAAAAADVPRGVAGALFCARGDVADGAVEFVAFQPVVRAPAPLTSDALEERAAALAALGVHLAVSRGT